MGQPFENFSFSKSKHSVAGISMKQMVSRSTRSLLDASHRCLGRKVCISCRHLWAMSRAVVLVKLSAKSAFPISQLLTLQKAQLTLPKHLPSCLCASTPLMHSRCEPCGSETTHSASSMWRHCVFTLKNSNFRKVVPLHQFRVNTDF